MMILKLMVLSYCYCSFAKGTENSGNESHIFGIRPVYCQAHELFDGIPVIYAGETSSLNVYGTNLTPTTEISFTYETDCDYPSPSVLKLSDTHSSSSGVVIFTPTSQRPVLSKTKYYVCLKDIAVKNSLWQHQGTGKHVSIYVAEPLFTTWMYVVIILMCYVMSSLMTGLNLGLMSLDYSELQFLQKAGTPKEKKCAGKIIPVRKNGNFFVCSVVITATLCNVVSTVATGSFFSDIITVVISTIMIVLFCEILPQSICSAYPLQIGARTICITRTCMILTFPISYPLSKVLNCIVGKELTKSYNKERLKELLKKTKLPTYEEKIISGTLEFSSKNVEAVMTAIDDVFKLPITTVLDFETIASILASGYSRVPIYVGEKWNIQYVLLTKELALLDPDEKVPVKVLVQKARPTCLYIPKGTTLDKTLQMFKDTRCHMLFVTDDENIKDKSKAVIGLLTFEDIIEEIFQMEIIDETDTIVDNREKRRVSRVQKTDIITLLLRPRKADLPSENVKLATYCFLSEIDEFSVKLVSPKVLISLLNLDIYYTTSGNKLPKDSIYVSGVPADYFVMILEGVMNVTIGNEELTFEAGPFRHFGIEALKRSSSFTPDYTVQAVKKTLYLKISCTLYSAALLATRFERFNEVPNLNPNSEVFKYFNQMADSGPSK